MFSYAKSTMRPAFWVVLRGDGSRLAEVWNEDDAQMIVDALNDLIPTAEEEVGQTRPSTISNR